MSRDDQHSDSDLKAYLEGKDGVSAAYRKTAREEPSAALDHAILNAARTQVKPGAGAKVPSVVVPYAMAASVMVGVLAATLYFSQLERFVQIPVSAPPLIRLEAERIAQPTARQEEAVQRGAPAVSEAYRLEASELTLAPIEIGIADTAAAVASTREVSAEVFVRAAEPPPFVIDDLSLEANEGEAAQAVADDGLEEIMVTASRVRSSDEADVSYRESRAEWLDEIRALTKELQARSRLTTASRNNAGLAAQLEEEMELFLAEYPDADLDAELAE